MQCQTLRCLIWLHIAENYDYIIVYRKCENFLIRANTNSYLFWISRLHQKGPIFKKSKLKLSNEDNLSYKWKSYNHPNAPIPNGYLHANIFTGTSVLCTYVLKGLFTLCKSAARLRLQNYVVIVPSGFIFITSEVIISITFLTVLGYTYA